MSLNIEAELQHLQNEVKVAKATKDQANYESEQAAVNAMLATRAYHEAVDILHDFLQQHDLQAAEEEEF
jgi:hypothetical protein